ncbi:MAG: phosphonate ABC transporter ATP-binding protein [Hyphomicrobiaceae bacterium]|nr:phosphonate ABC transporter ATP-binding protein [Hyphomicrobiaceae bacterium]
MTRPLLATAGLSKRYGTVQALVDAKIEVAAGEFVAVLGPSGSGKSTLFRCLTRLTEPDAGEIHLAGRPFHHLRGRKLAAARRDIGVVFQQFNLIRRRSALENVLSGRLGPTPLWRVAAGRFAPRDIARGRDALAAVGLADQFHQRADTLSGGQQQRVAIARAIAQESRILLADEPVASLDPATANSVLELIHGLTRSAGLGVVCTLHQPELAMRYADRVLTMDAGRLGVRPGASRG